MSSLAGVDSVVFEPAFDNQTGVTNVRPLHRNAEPRVTASPASGSDKNVAFFRAGELPVHLFDVIRDKLVVRRVERTAFYIYDIAHVADDAMSEHGLRSENRLLLLHQRQVFLHDLFIVNNRSDLQQVKSSPFRVLLADVDGKFNLHGATHLPLADLQQLIERISQRKDVVLQYIDKREYLPAAGIVPVADNHVIRVVGRYDIFQRAIGVGIFEGQFFQIEGVVHGEMLGNLHILQVERIEARLRLAKREIHRAHLQNAVRVSGREAERKPSVHDVLAEPQRDVRDAIFGLLVADWIEIERTGNAGDGGIEMIAVAGPDDLLQDHRHLFLVYQIGGCRHIRLAVAIKDGGIDGFDGVAQSLQHFVLIL